jgi:hypothetical protein
MTDPGTLSLRGSLDTSVRKHGLLFHKQGKEKWDRRTLNRCQSVAAF